MSSNWWSKRELTYSSGIRLLFFFHRLFGDWPFRVVIHPVVLFYLLRHPSMLSASQGYLRRVNSYTSENVSLGLWGSVRHAAYFAENVLDKLRIWAGRFGPNDVDFHNHHVVNDEVKAGRGGVIIVSHLGNVEVCRALTTRKDGIRLTVLMHTKHAAAFNRLLKDLDPASSMNILQVTEISADTVLLLKEKVEDGEFIVIAGDRVPVSSNPRVVMADFLGEQAPFPVGPYVIASLLQCPSYLLFCIRQGGRYQMYFERFKQSISLTRGRRNEELRVLASEFASRLGHYSSLSPLQWFNFYDFWAMPQVVSNDGFR